MRLALAVTIGLFLAALPARAEPLSWLDGSLLLAGEGLLVVDALQTLDIKRHPHCSEMNPILGKRPGDAKVIVYFATGMVLQAVLTRALPPRWRWAVPGIVIGGETWQVWRNIGQPGC